MLWSCLRYLFSAKLLLAWLQLKRQHLYVALLSIIGLRLDGGVQASNVHLEP